MRSRRSKAVPSALTCSASTLDATAGVTTNDCLSELLRPCDGYSCRLVARPAPARNSRSPAADRTTSHKIAQHFCLTVLSRSINGEMVALNCALGPDRLGAFLFLSKR